MPDCKNVPDPCDELPVDGEAWTICLPFGGRLWADGRGVHADGPMAPPADGVYGKVIIANGCIVGVEPEDVPLYTGSPCAPLPGDCGGGGSPGVGGGSGGAGGGSCQCSPSNTPGNLLTLDATGKPLVKLHIRGGDGVTITGNGTISSPYIISASSSGSGIGLSNIRSANDAIAVRAEGNTSVLEHKSGKDGIVNGMVFDAYGHLIDTTSGSVNKGVQGIVGKDGIEATTDPSTGITNIGLSKPAKDTSGIYEFGGYKVSTDPYGRIIGIESGIDLGGDVLVHSGTKDFMVNSHGSITSIVDTYNPGVCFNGFWDTSSGSATHIRGTFDMPYNAAISGVIFSTMDTAAWNGLAVFIDGVNCPLGTPDVMLKQSVSIELDASTNDASGGVYPGTAAGDVDLDMRAAALRLFQSTGIYERGPHVLDVYANGGSWPEGVGCHVYLWPTYFFRDILVE